MWLIFWYIIQSCISGYRDMAWFWQEGIWPIESKPSWMPWWKVKDSKDKRDPFHFAGGLQWALIIILLSGEAVYHWFTSDLLILKPIFMASDNWFLLFLTFALHGIFFWLFFYWIRNIFMHVIGMAKGYKRINYLWPPPIRWIFKMKG